MVIAEELAKKQKAISIAEFFEKNRQILGFDSSPRCLLTSVKEAVDNSLTHARKPAYFLIFLLSLKTNRRIT